MKPGWQRWRFEQMAQSINERVDDPSQAGVEYYVGLEHLDSDSLKIRRWGVPDDVSATKLLFEPGDIIFGRRRAYQRKLGVAEFRGIASAHSLVLRAKPAVVLPEFLPFFMQSDLFMERAQRISVGSLSPTINWKTLAKEEFALPPLEEQRQFANLLHAASNTQHEISMLMEEQQTLYQSAVDALVERLIPNARELYRYGASGSRGVITLGEFAVVTDCRHQTPIFSDEGIPIVSPGDLGWGELNLAGCKSISPNSFESFMSHINMRSGDFVIGRNQCVGIVSYVANQKIFAIGQDTVHVRARQSPWKFMYLMFRSTFVQRQITRVSMGTTFKRINLGDIRQLMFPVPDQQSEIESELIFDGMEAVNKALKSRYAAVISLPKAISMTVLGDNL
ncbi:restriction endonuclease subunit S [Thiocystis violacea]|uniref:restriction endonuclease subunit S n=1 Tax=Thiocystis violacea TaxID=13725 RepID=UPI0019089A60|nr:restriction endonuclease subunit S [Thiocystis violacea]